jgi:hypothetical protein
VRKSQLAQDKAAEAAAETDGVRDTASATSVAANDVVEVPLVRPLSRLCAGMEALVTRRFLLLEDNGAAFRNLSLCVGLAGAPAVAERTQPRTLHGHRR